MVMMRIIMTIVMLTMTLLMTTMIIRMTMMTTYIHGPVLVSFPLELEEVAGSQQGEQHAVVRPGRGGGFGINYICPLCILYMSLMETLYVLHVDSMCVF